MNVADLFSALADATRIRVLEMLHERSRPVHELAAAFDISRPAISRHLRVLKEAGLVRELKKGRENVYSLQAQKLQPAVQWLKANETRAPKAGKAVEKGVVQEIRPSAARAVRPARPVEPPKAPPPAPPAPAPQLSFFDL